MKRLFSLATSLLLLAGLSFGQALNVTTLASAVTSTDTTITLASNTGIVEQNAFGQFQSYIFSNDEQFAVISYLAPGTASTTVIVRRGLATRVRSHASGSVAYIGPPGAFLQYDLAGSCTAANQPLPMINERNGYGFDCRSSRWIRIFRGTMSSGAATAIQAFCTGTAGSAETEYLNGAACSGATTSTARYVVATPGTLANLRVSLSAAGKGGSNKDVLTVQKNGSDTTLVVSLADTPCATGVAAACIDAAHSVSVAAGDVITFKFVSDTSDSAANVSAVVELF